MAVRDYLRHRDVDPSLFVWRAGVATIVDTIEK